MSGFAASLRLTLRTPQVRSKEGDSLMTIFVSARKGLLLSILAATAMSASAAPKGADPADLFSFASGARILKAPDDAQMAQMSSSPLNLIDDSTVTDWTGEAGEVSFVFELAETTELSRIAFDSDGAMSHDDSSIQDFVVEVSETSATKGYQEVLSGKLKMKKNGQSFSFKPEERPVARWVRLTVLSNYGNDYQGFTGFHGYGKQLTQEATMPDMSGKYDGASGWGRVNIHDSDEGVTGCYSYQQGEFDGIVDGRVLKLNMHQRADGARLNGLFQMLPGGKLIGIVRNETDSSHDFYADYYSAEKAGGKPNSC